MLLDQFGYRALGTPRRLVASSTTQRARDN
jgi:hypothetical protein